MAFNDAPTKVLTMNLTSRCFWKTRPSLGNTATCWKCCQCNIIAWQLNGQHPQKSCNRTQLIIVMYRSFYCFYLFIQIMLTFYFHSTWYRYSKQPLLIVPFKVKLTVSEFLRLDSAPNLRRAAQRSGGCFLKQIPRLIMWCPCFLLNLEFHTFWPSPWVVFQVGFI